MGVGHGNRMARIRGINWSCHAIGGERASVLEGRGVSSLPRDPYVLVHVAGLYEQP